MDIVTKLRTNAAAPWAVRYEHDGWINDAADEIEQLRASSRMLWQIVNANMGFKLRKYDMERYPGDDQIYLQITTDPVTGDKIIEAGTFPGG